MQLIPYIIGSGMASNAMETALMLLQQTHSELQFAPAVKVGRDQKLKDVISDPSIAIVMIANPHGLHFERILEADALSVRHIFSEKPVCTSLQQVQDLLGLSTPVNVFHGYRFLWGPQEIKKMIKSGDLGKVISIEGRYWQCSEALRVLDPSRTVKGWKGDMKLSGGQDTLFDLGTHWMDMVLFLGPGQCDEARVWLYYRDQSHRDNHIHIQTQGGIRSFGSVSKIFHGGSNNMEVNVVGTHGSVSWKFLNPDELVVGKGNRLTTIQRESNQMGIGLPPFHGAGWIEGYVEVIKQGLVHANYNFEDALRAVDLLLRAQREETN